MYMYTDAHRYPLRSDFSWLSFNCVGKLLLISIQEYVRKLDYIGNYTLKGLRKVIFHE